MRTRPVRSGSPALHPRTGLVSVGAPALLLSYTRSLSLTPKPSRSSLDHTHSAPWRWLMATGGAPGSFALLGWSPFYEHRSLAGHFVRPTFAPDATPEVRRLPTM